MFHLRSGFPLYFAVMTVPTDTAAAYMCEAGGIAILMMG
jgi:hypothetical protein